MRFARVLAAGVLLLSLDLAGCRNRNPTGELFPPKNAPEWEGRFNVAFDDDYTRESIQLAGRAPNDVLDQRLFAARLGHADFVALVTVDQVWGKGRYQGRQNQYLDVTLQDTLIGEIPKGTHENQLLLITGEDELPGELQGREMILFVRWAPGSAPPYHHHLMPAGKNVLEYIDAMVKHAQREGVLDEKGAVRKRARGKKTKRRKRKAKASAEAKASTK